MVPPDPSAPGGAAAQPAKRRTAVGRATDRFIRDPSSARNAILLIIVADLATVVVGGLVIWTFDRPEFEHLTEGFWYILQTVTTVGYGDVTPTAPIGRLIGAAVMLLGIATLSILTASITSSFIEARQAERRVRDDVDEGAYRTRMEGRLDEVIDRLDRLERPNGENPGGDREPGEI